MSVGPPAARPGTARTGVPRAKIAIPLLPPRYLSRPRLLAALGSAACRQVTLVCAPAGYGKTLLLAEWAAQRPERTAWVCVDEDDNDDTRFWSAILDAIAPCLTPLAGDALLDLAVPAGTSAAPGFLAALVGAVDAAAEPVRLVLDDLHDLTDPRVLRGLGVLVRDRPPNLHLVLASRSDPPLPLPRLRLDGELFDIRARDLRFSEAEAQAMVAAAHVPARPDQVHLLVEQTEGWPAGLWLAALSLRDAEDPDAFLADMVGNSRAVSEYLVGEVLSGLPRDVLELLQAVSVCDRVSAALATALSGRPDAGDVLDALERETALVLSSGEGRQWYRVHPLLRAHLNADLRRLRPGLVPELHERAARWYAEQGELVVALAHARRARDPDGVARMLREHAVALIAGGQLRAVGDTLDALPDELLAGDPPLALVAALVKLEAGDVPAAERSLARATAAWPAEATPDLEALRALAVRRRATIAGHPDDLDDCGPVPGEPDVAALTLLDRALGLLVAGEGNAARGLAEAALDTARRRGRPYLAARALTVLGVVVGTQGDYRGMTALAEQADAVLPGAEWARSAGAALAAALRANGALLRAEPAECLEYAAAALMFADPDGPRPSDAGYVMLMALRGAALFDLGQRDAGLAALGAARSVAAGGRADPRSCAMAAMFGYTAAARVGRGDLARAVLAFAEGSLGHAAEISVLRAAKHIAAGRDRAAVEALQPVLAGAVAPLLPWVMVEAHVLECLLAARNDRRPLARQALEQALAIADTTDALRPLVTAPAAVGELLTRHLGGFGRLDAAADRVLAARNRLGGELDPVPLTPRERDVLALLPTNRSMSEIADDLAISPSTVKTHVRAIYDKLGVGSRREAIAAARRRGYLGAVTA